MNTSIAQQQEPIGWAEMHLGTLVNISGHAESETIARTAIAAAFKEVALIHRLMSFHLKDSDVSRLNREAGHHAVKVDPRTVEVVRAACEMSFLSDGHFDVTVAPELVNAGHLPRPASASVPSNNASWRDIEVVSDDAVLFHKPLWLDLGGIAKGYAVDRAFQVCLSNRLSECLVNASGDIRLSDGMTGSVKLDVPVGDTDSIGCVELTGGSIASSCGLPNAISHEGTMTGSHVDGVTRSGVDPMRFVSVLAEDCMVADALTKVVLILGDNALPVLSKFAATAFMFEKETGWQQIPPESITTDSTH